MPAGVPREAIVAEIGVRRDDQLFASGRMLSKSGQSTVIEPGGAKYTLAEFELTEEDISVAFGPYCRRFRIPLG